MDRQYVFEARLQGVPGIDGAYVEFPYDVEAEFGTKGRVKVVATFDGVEYRGILVNMRTPCHIIGVTKEIRQRIGKQVGDMITVTIRADTEDRVTEMPAALSAALEQSEAASRFFATLTSSQKNKFIDFVASAKKPETADRRLRQAIDMLERGEKMR